MKTVTMFLLLATAVISYSAEPTQVHHLGVSEKSATYRLLDYFSFEDIDALEGMWAKKGVALKWLCHNRHDWARQQSRQL